MSKHYVSLAELNAGLDEIRQSPKDQGAVKMIVIRPDVDTRETLQSCKFSPELGPQGDRWSSMETGVIENQVTLMNARAIQVIAQTEDRWPLAGDNLYVDLDLSEDNLQPGQQLSIGSVLAEVTPLPHNGCQKFAKRFGTHAVKFVNDQQGKHLHLRGIQVKILEAGTISVGDTITKVN